ncbi:hypothetical protein ACLTEW_00785 [Gordonia lacunae]|uniref:hypothetical protein n=1 Tax=Gordonia lacunae TaxID=417102 RepID=UPI0039E316EA
MRAIAFKGNKGGFDWALVEGDHRANAAIIERSKSPAPVDEREAQLAWIFREVEELLRLHTPSRAAILKVGGGTFSDSLGERLEVDGVILATLGSMRVPTQAIKSVSLAKQFNVKKTELDALLDTFPCINGLPKTHREIVALGLSQLSPKT